MIRKDAAKWVDIVRHILYLVQSLGILVKTAVGFFQTITNSVKGRLDRILEFGQSHCGLTWVYTMNQ